MFKTTLLVLALSVQPAFSSGLRIVTDIPPIGSLVAQVAKELGDVEVLVRSGASAHHYSLKPSDVKSIAEADLIIFVDESLTTWLPGTIEKVAVGTDTIVLNEVNGLTLWSFRENELFAGHEDEEEDGHDHSHGDGHSEHDPHTWLDPKNAQIWLKLIGERLSQLDPMNSSRYMSNAEAAVVNAEKLSEAIIGKLAKPTGDFFVYHDAFQYFERRFDVVATGSISAGDASSPSAARMASLREKAVSGDVSCVFSEPQFSENLISSVFEGRDTKHAIIDPLGSLLPIDENLYAEVLNDVAQKFADCSQ